MATFARRELDGFLTSATHSGRCTGQGIEVDSTPSALSLAVLRGGGVPDNLFKLWLGHSQNLMDRYAAQLRYDLAYQRQRPEKAGLGFELGELGYKSEAPIRPALAA
jgi:hypothetical protein